MTQVTVTPTKLSAYARTQQSAADEVGAAAARQRGEIGELTATFGVIGADFLAATAYVLDQRTRHLDAAARRHHDQASHTDHARAAYTGADEQGLRL